MPIGQLLDDFDKLNIHAGRYRTFMEIAGVPRRETVCSNILAFFLDPGEPHGFGTLVLDALVGAADISSATRGSERSVSVECEVRTADDKRIDILIQTNDYVVAIENKIDARLNNPLAAYDAHLKENFADLGKHKLLLTLSPTDAGREWGFGNLTYGKFTKRVRSMLGNYISGADTRYLTLFLDYLNTLDSLERGTGMDPRLIDFLAERHEEVESLFSQMVEVKREMKTKTRELHNLVDPTGHNNVEQRLAKMRPPYLYEGLIHDIAVSPDLVVRIHTNIFPAGWELWIFALDGSYGDLRSYLEKLEIPFDEYEEDEEDEGVFHRDNLVHKYRDDLDGIRGLLQGLIDKLATGNVVNR